MDLNKEINDAETLTSLYKRTSFASIRFDPGIDISPLVESRSLDTNGNVIVKYADQDISWADGQSAVVIENPEDALFLKTLVSMYSDGLLDIQKQNPLDRLVNLLSDQTLLIEKMVDAFHNVTGKHSCNCKGEH